MGAGLRAVVAWLFVVGFGATTATAEPILDEIVARVDQDVVTWSQVLQETELLRLEGASGAALEPSAVEDALIRRRLLVAEAKRLRLEVEPGAVGKELKAFLEADGGEVLPSLRRLGLGRRILESRAHERLMMEQYLGLRREMTFVPESEIRKSYGSASREPGQGSLAEARDQLRARLAEGIFQRELDQWIERQVQEGRVVRNPLPNP